MKRIIIAFLMAAVMTALPAVNVLAETEEAFLSKAAAEQIEVIIEWDEDIETGKDILFDDSSEIVVSDLKNNNHSEEISGEFQPEDSAAMLSIYHKAKEAFAAQHAVTGIPAEESKETEFLSGPDDLYTDFPESYHSLLLKLHDLYPQWEFVADPTGLDWNEAVEAETTPSRSLVENTEADAWKSRKDADYDFESNRWKGYDGSAWVAANREIVAYYMDPRNWLQVVYSNTFGQLIKNKSIFQFLDYSYDPNVQNKEGVLKMTEGTFLAGTPSGSDKSYTDMIMKAAEEWSISPYVLTAFIIQEQGQAGASPLISGEFAEYPGLYNFLNVCAYSTSSMTSVQHGLWWAKGEDNGLTSYGRPWDSREKAINGGAQYLAENYLNGFQNTVYYKRFNVSPFNTKTETYTHQYMTNVAGAWAEGYLLGESCEKNDILYENYSFHIPVYENMPEMPCAKPEDTMLSSVKLEGIALSEAFAIDRTEYSAQVPENTQHVYIEASPLARTAVVSGTGARALTGENTSLDLEITTAAGKQSKVTIRVYRPSVQESEQGSSSGENGQISDADGKPVPIISGGGGTGGSGGGGRSSGGGGGSSSSRKSSSGGPGAVPAPAGLPSYVKTGTWSKLANGKWSFTDSAHHVYTNEWAAVYNPYANTAIGQPAFDWYYFGQDSTMVTGWFTDPRDGHAYWLSTVSDGRQGWMYVGMMQLPDGIFYYFNEVSDGTKGALLKNYSSADGTIRTNASGQVILSDGSVKRQ